MIFRTTRLARLIRSLRRTAAQRMIDAQYARYERRIKRNRVYL